MSSKQINDFLYKMEQMKNELVARPVWVEVTTSAEATSSPVVVVAAGLLHVDVPLVVGGVVLGTIRVDQGLHKHSGVAMGIVFLLPKHHKVWSEMQCLL